MLNMMNSKKMYNAYLSGAKEVMLHKSLLNRINVFPVADGDTGSNLFSTMHSIIKDSQVDTSVKVTLESIADAALSGARGNSGIIFAQYLNGLSSEMEHNSTLTIHNFTIANQNAVQYAYDAISNPTEGTMITVIKAWADALHEWHKKTNDFIELLTHSFKELETSLKNTPNQLKVLKKASVVDSGAKGFVYFIKGFLEFLKNGHEHVELDDLEDNLDDIDFAEPHHHDTDILYRYCTEAMIEGQSLNHNTIKYQLSHLGDSLIIAGNKRKTRIHIHTDEPYKVFDILGKMSRITFQKVDDMKIEKDVVQNRKSDIALVTDSIADLPQSFIDEHQIHVINLNILVDNTNYFDKLTIKNEKILDYVHHHRELPTSSQPNYKTIEHLFSFLLTYYQSVIVVTVSKELSGTYNIIHQVAKTFEKTNKKISVVNSKQNSGAQGLLVRACAEAISSQKSHDDIVKDLETNIEKSKILVSVKTLDNMIKSGRLSVKQGKLANFFNLKPIVTLDDQGKGTIGSIAFSEKGCLKKLIKHIKQVDIQAYAIVHANDLTRAQAYAKKFEEIIGKEALYIEEISSITAMNAGQGAIAISYIAK